MVVEHRVGSNMSYWIMPISGQPMAETSVQNFTHDYMLDPDIAFQIKYFDKALTKRLKNANFIIDDFDGFGIK